jgi:hypothetical protein
MIVRENRALSERIRDRCKRTRVGTMLWISKQTHSLDDVFTISAIVLLLLALMREFARVSRAIIHEAAESKKTPQLLTIQIKKRRWSTFGWPWRLPEWLRQMSDGRARCAPGLQSWHSSRLPRHIQRSFPLHVRR